MITNQKKYDKLNLSLRMALNSSPIDNEEVKKIQEEMRKYQKTENASKVLQLLDKDFEYFEAIQIVIKKTGINREQLEYELEPFI